MSSELAPTTEDVRREIDQLRTQIDQYRAHLHRGMADQDDGFLDACRRVGADPRRSVRLGIAANGEFIASAAHSRAIQDVFDAVRRAPRSIEIEFVQRPILDEPPALPEGAAASAVEVSQSSKMKDDGNR